MECARIFFLFMLLALVQCETGQNAEEMDDRMIRSWTQQKELLASVREFPSRLHKCTASFIRRNILVTTARCLICEGKCKLFAHVLSSHLTDDNEPDPGQSYNIIETAIHPDYQRVPQLHDVGLAKLENDVTKGAIFTLLSDLFDKPGFPVHGFYWQFTDGVRDYVSMKKSSKTISNAICSLILNRYIDYKRVCVRPENPITLGPFDEGSPLVADINGDKILVGMYTTEGITYRRGVVVYDSMFPSLSWIHDTIACNFKCNLFYEQLPPSIPTTVDTTDNAAVEGDKAYVEVIEINKKPKIPEEDRRDNTEKQYFEVSTVEKRPYSSQYYDRPHYGMRPYEAAKISYILQSSNNDTLPDGTKIDSPHPVPTSTTPRYHDMDENSTRPRDMAVRKAKARRRKMYE